MTFQSKTSKVQALIRQGARKEALALASDFRIGITEAQRRAMKVGYECFVWPTQYAQMGVDPEAAIERAWLTLLSLEVLKEKTL